MESTRQRQRYNLGKTGWAFTVYAACVYLITGPFWMSNATNVIVPQMMVRLGYDSTGPILTTNSICTLICAVLGIVVILIYNRGIKRTRLILGIEMFLLGLTIIILGYTKTRIGYAIDYTCVCCLSMTIPQAGINLLYDSYMPSKKGISLGWATIGSSLSAVVSLPVISALTTRVSYNVALYVCAAYIVVMGILNLILWPYDPRDRGYEPDNGETPPELVAARERVENNEPNWTMKEAMTNRNFWVVIFGYGNLMMLCGAGMSQLVVYQTMNGVDQGSAVLKVSICALVGVVGSAISGYIDNAFGVKVLGILISVFFAVSFFILGILPFSMAVAWIFCFLFGFFVGATSNALPSFGIGIYGPDMPKIWRVSMPCTMALSAIASLVLGVVVNIFGSYQRAYVVFGVFSLIALVLIATGNSTLTKEPGKKPVPVDPPRKQAREAAKQKAGDAE